MGKVNPDNDNFIFGFVIGGLELEFECIFHADPIRGGQNQPQSMDNLQMGRLDASWVVSVGSVEVNSMMKSTKTCSLIVVLGLYLMSNSLNSMAHFTSLPELSVLCSICFIGCSVGISMV